MEDPIDEARVEVERAQVLDTCNWQMANLLRYSQPSRITEAEPYLRAVIEGHEGPTPEDTPAMLLAVALHKTPGRENEAYKILKDAMEHGDGGAGPYTFLWAKSAIARMLRRVKRDEEAKELEEEVIDWIKWHPYGMPPSKLRALVVDDAEPDDAPNAILDDPRVKEQLGNAVEIPGGIGMFGNTVIHFG
ncbi:hypothetical protein PENSPDRAFT_575246 [Peniophora sp. CONT]|nr:hypothetical protein PENSPDRAFT_575246 [Peniophora sp. CONT]